jgi:hypothetical protein
MHNVSTPWSVAIICSREEIDIVSSCIEAAVSACGTRSAAIDVLVNGNKKLAEEASALYAGSKTQNCIVRVWYIPLGDKAHAWNEYVDKIWQCGSAAFFIDGYVQVRPDAFDTLSKSLSEKRDALAATGVPSSGRSAAKWREQMLAQGGLMGGMHVIAADVMSKLRKRKIRLPLGLYRTDSLIGAILMFSLDPTENAWDVSKVAVSAEATCDIPGLSALTFHNVRAQIKRLVRQAQGDLENSAMQQHLAIERRAPETLPVTNQELVRRWLGNHSAKAFKMFFKRPIRIYAVHKLNARRDWHLASESPILLSPNPGLKLATHVDI